MRNNSEMQNIFTLAIDEQYEGLKEETDYSFESSNLKGFDFLLNSTRKSSPDGDEQEIKISASESTEDVLSEEDGLGSVPVTVKPMKLTEKILTKDWKKKVNYLKANKKLEISITLRSFKKAKSNRKLTFDCNYNYQQLNFINSNLKK